jgi:hypothetical protein
MKNLKRIMVLSLAVMMMVQPLRADSRGEGLEPLPGKNKNLFILKVERRLVGAEVKVMMEDDVVSWQTLPKRKMIIDFTDVRSGSYVIRIEKGKEIKEYIFTKE